MKLSFEYGAGLMAAELPDTTDIFIPGETVPDPACIPEDRLVEETLKSIRNPMGMEPLSELAHKFQGYHYFPGPCKRRRAADVPP